MYYLLLLTSLGAVLLYRLLGSVRRRRLPLPPGPKGLPIIGNLWDVPAEYPWLTYAKWTATYGDVFYLDTPGNPTVVINSAQAVTDLFEKRSGNYSDRPGMDRNTEASELLTPCRFHHCTFSGMGGHVDFHEIFELVEVSAIMVSADIII